MKKLFTLALGGLLTIGAVAYAIPAVTGNAPSLYADEETPAVTPNGVDNETIAWSPDAQGFKVSFTAPTTGYYYDSNWNRTDVNLTSIDYIAVYRGEGWSADTEVARFSDATPGADYSCVDPNLTVGSEYAYKIVVVLGEKSFDTWSYSNKAGLFPAAIDIKSLNVATTQGQVPITFTFTAPATYTNGDAITGTIDRIELYSSTYDYTTSQDIETVYGTLEEVTPGSEQTITLTELPEGVTTGRQNWRLRSYAADGYSAITSVDFLIGEDAPGQVRNLAATSNADGSVTLTWDAPEKGQNNGYFNPDNVTYRVTYTAPSSYSEEEAATGLNETTYTVSLTVETAGMYKFNVYAVSPAGQSYSSYVSAILGPNVTLPLKESFSNDDGWGNYQAQNLWTFSTTSTESYPNTFRVNGAANINGSSVKPVGEIDGMGAMPYYDDTKAETSAITSHAIDIEEGVGAINYEFYYYALAGKDYSIDFQVQFNDGEFTTAKHVDMATETEWAWVKAEGQVEVPAGTTTAHVRFQFANGAGSTESMYLLIDEIKVSADGAEAQIFPAAAENLTAAYDLDANAIAVEFDAPSKTHARLGDINNEDLPYISKIEIYRQYAHNDYVLVHTIENPEVGSHQKWVDSNLEGTGNYYYKVLCYFNENCEYGQFLNNPVIVGQIPVDVNDLRFDTNKGQGPVTLIFTLPAKDTAGLDLREIKSVTVERYNNSNGSWGTLATVTEDLVPGAEFSYVDNTVATDQTYQYRVTVTGSAGSNYGTQGSVFVGVDNPASPSNVVATLNADGTVTVTWDPITESQNGGWYDAENLTYTVLWGTGYSEHSGEATLVAEGLTECSYTGTIEIEQETAVTFFVKGVTGELTGYSASSNKLILGNPSALPYVETFGKSEGYSKTSDHIWTGTSDQPYSAWTIGSYAYTTESVYPQAGEDSGDGLAYAYYNSYNTIDRNDYLTSGKIDVKGQQVLVAKIDVYQIPGYETKLAFETAFDSGEFTTEYTFEYKDFTTQGWATYYIPFEVPAGAEILNIRIHAMKVGASNTSVIVDGIDIFALDKPVITTSENAFSWDVAANDYLEVSGWNFYHNEDPAQVLDATSNSFTVASEADNGTYAVQALYHENTIAGPVSDEAIISYDALKALNNAAISVKAINGTIVVTCADTDNVTISAVNGQVLFQGQGAAKVAVVPGIYMVKVANAPAVKLNVR